jgi:hypothetical protein
MCFYVEISEQGANSTGYNQKKELCIYQAHMSIQNATEMLNINDDKKDLGQKLKKKKTLLIKQH